MSFVELNAYSYYSFLEGASSPEEIAQRAAACGMPAVALTDRNGLYGAIPFYRECQRLGIKPIIGAEVTLATGDDLVVLCRSNKGYSLLCRAITRAYEEGGKDTPAMSTESLNSLTGHVICLVGGARSKLRQLIEQRDLAGAEDLLRYYVSVFGHKNVYVTLQHHNNAGDQATALRFKKVADAAEVGVIATNSPLYATREQAALLDVLLCIKHGVTISSSHHQRPGNHEHYIKDAAGMREALDELSDAVGATEEVAARCEVTLDFSEYRLPEFEVPDGHDADSWLAMLCQERVFQMAMQRREERHKAYSLTLKRRLAKELALIHTLGLAGYFLVVWDIVQFAKKKGIPVQGRGSAANSLVAFLLGITPIDPITNRLFLGRFIHAGMTTIPDIDLDFASSRDPDKSDREDVIQYVYEKYGADHVAMVCTFVTFQARSAIREVGKVLEMPDDVIDRMAKMCGHSSSAHAAIQALAETPEFVPYLESSTWKAFRTIVTAIGDVPRHPSIHVGGMLIASCPISDFVPLEPARMEGRVVCQWDKDMVDDAGLIKVDILGLGMLAALREAVELIEDDTGTTVVLDLIPDGDQKVYDAIGEADTIGVFQIESRAQMQCLPRTKPRNFAELGIQVAIIRPGPLQGNMVSPYILRKQGKEPVTYMHSSLERTLKNTLGVILFQEQVLQVASRIANFTDAQAEGLRRAMSRKRSKDAMGVIKQQFYDGAKELQVPRETAASIFKALEGFAQYGFCKSHALSFARITYMSAWLKVHYPAAFVAALVNNQPMGFYPTKTLLEDARRHGVRILPLNINASKPRCHLDEGVLRLGFILVNSVGHEAAVAIAAERDRGGPYRSLRDFVVRVKLDEKIIEVLVQAGAFDVFGLARRELLWQLWLIDRQESKQQVLVEEDLTAPSLPTLGLWEVLKEEYRVMGFSPEHHPVRLLRDKLSKEGIVNATGLGTVGEECCVKVAGMVVCRQRPPTAKGFAFLTLEDESGLVNVVVPPQLYEQRRRVFRLSPIVVIEGQLQRQDGVTNIRANTMHPFDS